MFPKFGAWEAGPNHGFARVSPWRLAASSEADLDVINASFELVANDETKALWNFDFKLTYVVALGSDSLTTTLVVDNLGAEAFEFETLLHTYFRVPDITKVKIQGLGGSVYRDQVRVWLACDLAPLGLVPLAASQSAGVPRGEGRHHHC